MKQNLVDQTCELLKWLCNYRKLHTTTTKQQFWQYPPPPYSWSNQTSDVAKCRSMLCRKLLQLGFPWARGTQFSHQMWLQLAIKCRNIWSGARPKQETELLEAIFSGQFHWWELYGWTNKRLSPAVYLQLHEIKPQNTCRTERSAESTTAF